MNEEKLDFEQIAKQMQEQFIDMQENSKKIYFCPHCEHNKVCKKIEEEKSNKCEDFLDASSYKRYPSIHNFFQPIFDWMNYHHPNKDIKFFVDYGSAQMDRMFQTKTSKNLQLRQSNKRKKERREFMSEIKNK